MRLFISIIASFLIAMILQILPLSTWAVWLQPAWVVLTLIFWVLVFPAQVGTLTAFVVGLWMDLLMGGLLGEHAAIFVIIAYVILRFQIRISLLLLWQQAIVVGSLILIMQTYLSWISGFLDGFRADAWFWMPAVTSALIWPLFCLLLKSFLRHIPKVNYFSKWLI